METPALANVVVLGARLADASRFAANLNDRLLQAGIHVSVRAADQLTPDLNLAGCTAVFLLGLSQGDKALEPLDQALRAGLLVARVDFQVLYGSDDESLERTIRAVRRFAAAPGLAQLSPTTPKPEKPDDASGKTWGWQCDKCSDPQCEHRLLTDLLAERKACVKVGLQAKFEAR